MLERFSNSEEMNITDFVVEQEPEANSEFRLPEVTQENWQGMANYLEVSRKQQGLLDEFWQIAASMSLLNHDRYRHEQLVTDQDWQSAQQFLVSDTVHHNSYWRVSRFMKEADPEMFQALDLSNTGIRERTLEEVTEYRSKGWFQLMGNRVAVKEVDPEFFKETGLLERGDLDTYIKQYEINLKERPSWNLICEMACDVKLLDEERYQTEIVPITDFKWEEVSNQFKEMGEGPNCAEMARAMMILKYDGRIDEEGGLSFTFPGESQTPAPNQAMPEERNF